MSNWSKATILPKVIGSPLIAAGYVIGGGVVKAVEIARPKYNRAKGTLGRAVRNLKGSNTAQFTISPNFLGGNNLTDDAIKLEDGKFRLRRSLAKGLYEYGSVTGHLAHAIEHNASRPDLESEAIDAAISNLSSLKVDPIGNAYAISNYGNYETLEDSALINNALLNDLNILSQSLINESGRDKFSPVLKNKLLFEVISGVALSKTSSPSEDLKKSQDVAMNMLRDALNFSKRDLPQNSKVHSLVTNFLNEFTGDYEHLDAAASIGRTAATADFIDEVLEATKGKSGNYAERVDDYCLKIFDLYGPVVGSVVKGIVSHETNDFLSSPLSKRHLGNEALDYETGSPEDRVLNSLSNLWIEGVPPSLREHPLVQAWSNVISSVASEEPSDRQKAINDVHNAIDEDVSKLRDIAHKIGVLNDYYNGLNSAEIASDPVAIRIDDASIPQLELYLDKRSDDLKAVYEAYKATHAGDIPSLVQYLKEQHDLKHIYAPVDQINLINVKNEISRLKEVQKKERLKVAKVRIAMGKSNENLSGLAKDVLRLVAFKTNGIEGELDDYSSFFDKAQDDYETSLISIFRHHTEKQEIKLSQLQAQLPIMEGENKDVREKFKAMFSGLVNFADDLEIPLPVENPVLDEDGDRVEELKDGFNELCREIVRKSGAKSDDRIDTLLEQAWIDLENKIGSSNPSKEEKLAHLISKMITHNTSGSHAKRKQYKPLTELNLILNTLKFSQGEEHENLMTGDELNAVMGTLTENMTDHKSISAFQREYRAYTLKEKQINNTRKSIEGDPDSTHEPTKLGLLKEVKKMREILDNPDYLNRTEAIESIVGKNVAGRAVKQLAKESIRAQEAFFYQTSHTLDGAPSLMRELRDGFVRMLAALLSPLFQTLGKVEMDEESVLEALTEEAQRMDSGSMVYMDQLSRTAA